MLSALPRAVQLLAKKADVWDEGIEQLFKDWDVWEVVQVVVSGGFSLWTLEIC